MVVTSRQPLGSVRQCTLLHACCHEVIFGRSDRTGQDRTGQDRTGQDRTGLLFGRPFAGVEPWGQSDQEGRPWKSESCGADRSSASPSAAPERLGGTRPVGCAPTRAVAPGCRCTTVRIAVRCTICRRWRRARREASSGRPGRSRCPGAWPGSEPAWRPDRAPRWGEDDAGGTSRRTGVPGGAPSGTGVPASLCGVSSVSLRWGRS